MPPFHFCADCSFSFAPAASPSSPLLQAVGFIVPFRAVLYHLEQTDQYFDIKRSIVRKEEANILITLVVTWSHQELETEVKNNRTFNLTSSCYNAEFPSIISIHIGSAQQS